MDVRIQHWPDVNSEELARFSLQIRCQEGFVSENINLDTYLTTIDWWSKQSKSTPIIAYDEERIVGWLVLFSFVPTTATIGRWHPIVEQGFNKDEIARQLLKTSIDHAREQNFDSFEMELTGITAETEFLYKIYAEWYEAQGFSLAAEEARWEIDLTKVSFPVPVVPVKFALVSLDQFTNEQLETPFFEMFDNSEDRFWKVQTPEQRKETFHFWFNREKPVVEEASVVLVKGEEIIGLTIVRPVQDAAMLGPIAIASRYRRRGLGRALMMYSLHGALQSGITKVQLEFDITNEPAQKLYSELGFEHVHRLAILRRRL